MRNKKNTGIGFPNFRTSELSITLEIVMVTNDFKNQGGLR